MQIKYKLPRTMLTLMFSFVFLNIMDLYTTYILLSLGGQEINPLFTYFNSTGMDTFSILIKIVLPLFECAVIYVLFYKAKSEGSNFAVNLIYIGLNVLVLWALAILVSNVIHTTYQLQEIDKVFTELGVW